MLKERTQTIDKKIKLHILGVPVNKLGNWLMFCHILFVVKCDRLCH